MKKTLKGLREDAKKSRSQIAKALNVSLNAVSNYESGIRSLNIEQVLILAKLYDCAAEEVIAAQIESIVVRQANKVIG